MEPNPNLQTNPFLILDEKIVHVDESVARVDERVARLEVLIGKLIETPRQEEVDNQERLLSSNECRKLFIPEISKSTLYRWNRDGLVRKYRLKGKVVYKKSEILSATKILKSYSHKKTSAVETGEV